MKKRENDIKIITINGKPGENFENIPCNSHVPDWEVHQRKQFEESSVFHKRQPQGFVISHHNK